MVVAEITADFDPDRDKGTASWTRGYDSKTNYEVPPVLWEIRRERMVELMGQGFSFYDIKRWHKAPYYVTGSLAAHGSPPQRPLWHRKVHRTVRQLQRDP